MENLLNIRKTLGIGQESMAALLGITRQALAKVERGICNLSTANLVKLTNLQVCLENLPAGEDEKQMPLPIEEQKLEMNREKECRYFVSVLERKLAKEEASYNKSRDLYKAICMMQPADEGDELWIQKMKNDIIKKLDECGPASCMRLRKRIYLLTAEAEYISRFVDETKINL